MSVKIIIWVCVVMAMTLRSVAEEPKFNDVLQKKHTFGLEKYPIGFYTDRLFLGDPEIISRFSSDREVRDWVEMGCTLMFSPKFNSEDPKQKDLMGKILRYCEKNNIKMLLSDRRFYPRSGTKGLSDAEYKKEVEKIGKYFSASSSFLGFMISDEPGKKTLPNTLLAARLQKMALPKTHPFINLGFEPAYVGKKNWEDYFGSIINDGKLDVLSYDIYAQMLDKKKISSYYFMILRNLRESSVRNGVPFWTILLATPHLYFVTPTLDDIRWQFNTAVCHGSSGIFWWFYYDGNSVCANYRNSPVDWNWDKTESWHYFKRVHQKFHHQYKDLFNQLVTTRVSHYPKMVGGVTWTPNAILKKIQVDVKGGKKDVKNSPVLIGEFIDKDKRTYLMVVNNSRKANAAVRLTFPENCKLFYYDKGVEKEGHALEYGMGKHWLAPGQEVVYRVELQD